MERNILQKVHIQSPSGLLLLYTVITFLEHLGKLLAKLRLMGRQLKQQRRVIQR
nr:MAG TPA: hypothetical protein [Caudoviricetes sp.]